MPPAQSYILCTSPRSGSTLLCRLLAATGQCGVPGSHFHEPSLAAWLDDYDLKGQSFPSDQAALATVFEAARRRGQGATGMFGLRLQRHSAPFFFEQLETLHPGMNGDHARLQTCFGATRFIYLTRQTKLDQAISYVKAQQTGLWHRAPDGTEIERLGAPCTPSYDRAALTRQIAEFEAYEREWQHWFAQEGITPLTLTYDALGADPLGVLAQILRWLGVDPRHAQGIPLPVAKLADKINAEWAARYRAEIG